MYNFLNKVFKLEENQTTVKTEVIAGLTTFFAMCYIVIVNPSSMAGDATTFPWLYNACFIGGIVAAVIATLCMAFIANKPFALAAGMGLNSYFFVAYILPCILNPMLDPKQGYAEGLAIILMSGILFLVLSVTGARKYIATSLPPVLKIAMPAGIGLFIAFLGFQNSGFIVNNDYTLVQIANFTEWSTACKPLVAFIGLVITVVFAASKNKVLKGGSIILGIAASTAVYYIFSIWTPELRVSASLTSVGTMFSDWAKYGLFNLSGFKTLFSDSSIAGGVISVIMLVITYCLIDMFDTIGTLYGASAQAGMLDENGDPLCVQEEMLCDSIGTVVGALTGTSTITTFVESASGVAAGGRTGLASFVTAILFLICLFVGPVVAYIPSCATAAALIYVGILMLKNIVNVDFTDLRDAATAFMTVVMMLATYSITNGIMLGAIVYTLVSLLTGRFTKKDIVAAIIGLLGALKFALVVM